MKRLLDDKDFKKELLEFTLTEEGGAVKAEHRADLIPIILRLLYGRMRSAKNGGGKQGGTAARRIQILHYVMDFSEQQIRYFLDIVFADLYVDVDFKVRY